MKFYNEHTGYVTETTIIEFDIPKYSGCLTMQVYVTKFDGIMSLTYIDKSNTERKSNLDFSILEDASKSFIFSTTEQMVKVKFLIVFAEDSAGSVDKIAITT